MLARDHSTLRMITITSSNSTKRITSDGSDALILQTGIGNLTPLVCSGFYSKDQSPNPSLNLKKKKKMK